MIFVVVVVVVVVVVLRASPSRITRFHGMKLPVPRKVRRTIVGCYGVEALTECATNYMDHRRAIMWTGANATVPCRHLEGPFHIRQPEDMKAGEDEE